MAWYQRLRNLARSRRHSQELDRELAFHLDERVDELVARGMSERDARDAARRQFGNPTALKERTRDVDVLGWLESLLADARYAARTLRASPGFTTVVVLSLALGIGANTAIFGILDAVMLKSLPVERPGELVAVTIGDRAGNPLTNPIWEAVRDRQDVFAGIFATADEDFDLATGGAARRVAGAWVSGDYFATLGVRAAVGRVLARADDARGCAPVAVLGHGFWRSEYGGDPGVVGSTISLDGHPFEIVGVAAPGFFGVEVGRAVQVYAPLCAEAIVRGAGSTLDERSAWWLSIVGRPRPGTTLEQVRARLAAISPAVFAATLPNWDAEGQKRYLGNELGAVPAGNGLSALRARYRGALVALMAAVGVVLLVACANVANLLLARATARQREIGVRLAIGAGRRRIVRQLLTESVLLALVGAGLGVLLAQWGSELLVGLIRTRTDAVWLDLSLDPRVLGFTAAVAVGTGILFGLAPAWRATRVSPQSAMRVRDLRTSEGRSRFSLVRSLVVGQIALSLVLVTGAAFLVGTLRRLATLDPGFTSEGVLLVTADLRGARIAPERVPVAAREMLDRLRAIPGVRAASASAITPVSGAGWNGPITVEGVPATRKEDRLVWLNEVSDGYFETMGTRRLAGRDFDSRDRAGAPRVAIVNEALASKYFRAATPVGRRLLVELGLGDEAPVEIVGVVENAKYRSLREEPEPTLYLAAGQGDGTFPFLNFELRTDGPPRALAPAAAAAIGEVSASASLDFTTLSEQVAGSLSRERLLATLSAGFGALALLLAVVGLYGTIAYTVERRRNEIGIRLALGAARPSIVRMVLGEAGRMAVVGVAIGIVGALAAARLVSAFLYGVAPTDAATLVGSALTLLAAAAAAAAVPAWRAARLDPGAALREE